MKMNIYTKLQKMRVDLQNMQIKKSGENKFVGYKYYELGDILPPINKLMLDNGVAAVVSFGNEYASLKLINCEKPEEEIEFTSPMATATLKGAHDVQNLGAVETYQRRYLYMTAFEVVESDFFDATQGKPQGYSKPQSEPRAKTMSDDMGARLNDAIKAYSNLTGKKTKDIVSAITKETGKQPKNMSDEDGEAVLDLLSDWSTKFIEELGV